MKPVYYRSAAQRQHAMCRCKKRYKTEKEVALVGKRHGHRAYHCPHCLGYHLTSKKGDSS